MPEGVTRVSLDAASLMDGILKLATDTGENAVSEYFETASLATLLSNQGGPGESGAVSGFDVTTDDATKKPIISFYHQRGGPALPVDAAGGRGLLL